MRLDLETFGEKQFSREILRVGENAKDMRPAFDLVHETILGAERRQFSTQGTYSGGWKPLAPSTRARKARLNLDPRILHATLRLRNSLTVKTHVDHIYRVTADEMFIGSRVPYGPFHQKGTSNMPRRRPVEFNARIKNDIVKILQGHLMGGGSR